MTTKLTMTPAEVLKLIKRTRAKGPTSIGVHVGIDMPSTEGKYYPNRALITLTMGQATRMLNDLQRFHDLKVKNGQAPALLNVSESTSEYDERQRHIYFG